MYKLTVSLLPDNIRFSRRSNYCEAESTYGKKNSVASHAGKIILMHMLGCRVLPQLAYTVTGKPFFRDVNLPWFNISHSGMYVAVMLSDEGPVGCDIEVIRPCKHWERVARAVFNDEEFYTVSQGSAGEILNRFWCTWTRKEAILKKSGGQLFHLPDIDSLCPSPEYNLKTYYRPDFCLSVCTPSACDNLKFKSYAYAMR